MVARMLQRESIDTTLARDGREAIEILENSSAFDVVLLDLMMPRVDGFGVLQFVREHVPALLEKVVVMTAFTSAARERIEPNCRLLPKPFDFQELVNVVRSCASDSRG